MRRGQRQTINITGGTAEEGLFNTNKSINYFTKTVDASGPKGNHFVSNIYGTVAEYEEALTVVDADEILDFAIEKEAESSLYTTGRNNNGGRQNCCAYTYRDGSDYILEIRAYRIEGAFLRRKIYMEATRPLALNIKSNGTKMLVTTGTEKAYLLTMDQFASIAVEEITDPDFPTSVISIDFHDTYFVMLNRDDKRFYISKPYATDPADFVDPLDFTSIDVDSQTAVAIASRGSEVVVFTSDSLLFYVNQPSGSGFPYVRANYVSNGIGALDYRGVTRFQDVFYFLGSGVNGTNKVFALNGYNTEQISTREMFGKLSVGPKKVDASYSVDLLKAYTYTIEGYSFLAINSNAMCIDTGEWTEIVKSGSDDLPEPSTLVAVTANAKALPDQSGIDIDVKNELLFISYSLEGTSATISSSYFAPTVKQRTYGERVFQLPYNGQERYIVHEVRFDIKIVDRQKAFINGDVNITYIIRDSENETRKRYGQITLKESDDYSKTRHVARRFGTYRNASLTIETSGNYVDIYGIQADIEVIDG